MKNAIINFAVTKPKTVIAICIATALIFFLAMPRIVRDTDPLHMLKSDNKTVLFYNRIKKDFNSPDMIGVGIERTDGSSLFDKDGMTKIYKITEEILKIKDQPEKLIPIKKLYQKLGLISKKSFSPDFFDTRDVISVSTSNDIVLNKNGELLVQPLLSAPPSSDEQAANILKLINNNPMLQGKLCAEDGSFVGIFIPIFDSKKPHAYYLGEQIKKILKKHLGPNEKFYYAGFPIAQATFAGEMFVQMGVYAPMAGLVIFLLLIFFFRSIKIVLAPMQVGIMTVFISMGALIYTGNVVHIIGSMIPIFLLPIAVLNSIHILSKLGDRLHKFDTKEEAIRDVVSELFTPMLFTSLTTLVGFLSLLTAGIPPVAVFGVTIAFGVSVAWLLSMTYIPAYTMFLSENALKKFAKQGEKKSAVVEVVQVFKKLSWNHPKMIIGVSIILIGSAIVGLPKIIVNDNSVRWFKKDHFIRKADIAFNSKLAGAYKANLVFTIPKEVRPDLNGSVKKEDKNDEDVFEQEMEEKVYPSVRNLEVVRYIKKMEDFLLGLKDEHGLMVGGVTGLPDVLKKIGKTVANDTDLPKSREQVSQYVFLFENGDLKRGRDLWKIINRDPNSRETLVRVLFKTGDNNHFSQIMEKTKMFFKQNPLPTFKGSDGKSYPLKVQWSGLLKVNNVWQDTMVKGMMVSFLESFGIVFLMMVFLFKSLKWGVISMLPLTVTISFLYGMIGHLGIFYNLPIAVLSSLSLGLAIDFAIHYIEHYRLFLQRNNGDFKKSFDEIFDGTAQAIWRNILVVAIGFIPLLFSALVPYITVGSFFFVIMFVGGITTLLLIPAIVRVFELTD